MVKMVFSVSCIDDSFTKTPAQKHYKHQLPFCVNAVEKNRHGILLSANAASDFNLTLKANPLSFGILISERAAYLTCLKNQVLFRRQQKNYLVSIIQFLKNFG